MENQPPQTDIPGLIEISTRVSQALAEYASSLRKLDIPRDHVRFAAALSAHRLTLRALENVLASRPQLSRRVAIPLQRSLELIGHIDSELAKQAASRTQNANMPTPARDLPPSWPFTESTVKEQKRELVRLRWQLMLAQMDSLREEYSEPTEADLTLPHAETADAPLYRNGLLRIPTVVSLELYTRFQLPGFILMLILKGIGLFFMYHTIDIAKGHWFPEICVNRAPCKEYEDWIINRQEATRMGLPFNHSDGPPSCDPPREYLPTHPPHFINMWHQYGICGDDPRHRSYSAWGKAIAIWLWIFRWGIFLVLAWYAFRCLKVLWKSRNGHAGVTGLRRGYGMYFVAEEFSLLLYR